MFSDIPDIDTQLLRDLNELGVVGPEVVRALPDLHELGVDLLRVAVNDDHLHRVGVTQEGRAVDAAAKHLKVATDGPHRVQR